LLSDELEIDLHEILDAIRDIATDHFVNLRLEAATGNNDHGGLTFEFDLMDDTAPVLGFSFESVFELHVARPFAGADGDVAFRLSDLDEVILTICANAAQIGLAADK
tara:strand:+ start:100 stop:420 length:321 start_codon:yes stop_codon:yes gene_type:complete